MLSSLSKSFEFLIARRLTKWAETNQILAQGHLGGRKNAGTEDALYVLDSWVRYKWEKGQVVGALFLDVKSAYPAVQPTRLIQYLCSVACPGYLLLIIQDFLCNRSTTIRLEDYESDHFNIEIGLPQGSPLSVILYILYNNSLLHHEVTFSADTLSLGYVDDVVVLVAASSLDPTVDSLHREGVRALHWGRKFGAVFDTKKAQLLWFSKEKQRSYPSVLWNELPLTPSTTVKWLGFTLDPQLSYKNHLEALGAKIPGTIRMLSIFGNSKRGADANVQRKLICSILFPRVLYGSVVAFRASNRGSVKALGAKVDWHAGIFVLGVFRSTSLEFIRERLRSLNFSDIFLRSLVNFNLRKMLTLSPNMPTRFLLSSNVNPTNLRTTKDFYNRSIQQSLMAACDLNPETLSLDFHCDSPFPPTLRIVEHCLGWTRA